jgi:LysM repeat protein
VGSTIKVPTERSFQQPETAAKTTAVQQPKQVNQPVASQQQAIVLTPGNKNDQTTKVGESNTSIATQYKVSAGETLYSIAKRFNTTVENITALNNLKTTTVSAGQILNIKTDTPAPPVVPQNLTDTPIVAKRDMTSVVADSSSAERRAAANRYGLYEKDEKGVATWMDDDGLDPNKKLVLHRTAPVGTVIRITNPMSNKTTFAKVVGRFTESESTKDVILVMTKGVAQALGALDKRVHVNISYGVPNE